MRPVHKIFSNIIFALLPFSAFALATDTDKTMVIEADSSVFDYKKGLNSYEGNIKIDQGTSHLTADRLTTQNNGHHQIVEAIAEGTKEPAHYWTIPKVGDVTFHAHANIIKFYPLKSIVQLEGNVTVNQGENTFRGPILIYNIKSQIVSAPATKNGHATIVIEPKQLTS